MKENNTKILIEYLIWADNSVFDIIENIEENQILKEFGVNNSLYFILLHLSEEYLGWYTDITEYNKMDEIKSLATKSPLELISSIKSYHKLWENYISKFWDKGLNYIIDEGDGLKVNVTLSDVIFNLVNHASYHRGQMVKLLRLLNTRTCITDYYWFVISNQRNSNYKALKLNPS